MTEVGMEGQCTPHVVNGISQIKGYTLYQSYISYNYIIYCLISPGFSLHLTKIGIWPPSVLT